MSLRKGGWKYYNPRNKGKLEEISKDQKTMKKVEAAEKVANRLADLSEGRWVLHSEGDRKQ